MAKEDYILQLSILQQQAGKIQEQIQGVNQQIAEFNILKASLEKLDKSDKEEILAPLGRGIYIKSKPIEKKLHVCVGQNVVLKKTPKETEGIIDKQIKELDEIKEKLIDDTEAINKQLQELVEKAQKEKV